MGLSDSVRKMLVRLWEGDDFWRIIFSMHGWDKSVAQLNAMDPDTLRSHLINDPIQVNRKVIGFEDFSLEGNKLVEPANPSKSLLYHAFASPNIFFNENSKENLKVFPTLFELDVLENFIYSLQPLNIDDLMQKEGVVNVALGVFSYEYRQGINTTHRKHADLCFSRTGVARVGDQPHKYEPNLRAFTIFPSPPQEKGIRVSPARYAAFIAVRRNINAEGLNVLPFLGNDKNASDVAKKRGFWVPVHKLFSGAECLANQLNIKISFISYHENTKLKKVCERLAQVSNRKLEKKPYTITDALVEMWHPPAEEGNEHSASVWVSPVPHPLVEEAMNDASEQVTIKVPPDPGNSFFAALTLESDNGARSAPEYVNVRRRLQTNGQVIDLNNEPNVSELVAKGQYNAIMYIDYTCDGWIIAECPEIQLKNLPAYSLVTAPDFIPFAEQRELIEWSESQPTSDYWALKPWALSDTRMLPNIALKNSPFSKDETDNTIHTLTAIVGTLGTPVSSNNSDFKPNTRRSSFLPDAAAGEFQPGWDISWDLDADKREHLAAYGLGSPFLEDAKLCAALSTFWPAAAPDIARSFAMKGDWPSICPLLDEEIGQMNAPAWDGIPGPKRIKRNGEDWVELVDFNHVDYVTQGLLKKFTISHIGQIDLEEYKDRIDSLWHIYKTLKVLDSKGKWRVLSFRKITKTDNDLLANIGNAAAKMQESIFSVTLYLIGKHVIGDSNKTIFEKITNENNFYVDNSRPRKIWRKKSNGQWHAV